MPFLRTHAWKRCELGKVTVRVTRKNKKKETTLPLTISAQEGLIDQNKFFNKVVASKDVSGYYLIKKGEFAYNKSYSKGYPLGAIKRLNRYRMGILSTLYIVFKPVNINSDFLEKYYATTNWHREVSKRAQEGARNHGLLNISPGDFFETELYFPELEKEQRLIAKLLNNLDYFIDLHERIVESLKAQKKFFLQNLFPKGDEDHPPLRFNGYSDSWEQRELGEEVLITMGQSPNSKNYTDNPRDHILVQGNADMKEGRVVPRVWTTQVTKQAKKGDLILSVRAPVGDVGKTDYNAVIGRGVASIKGNDFIYQQLIKMKSTGYWSRYSTGSTFESINSSEIKHAEICVASELEQQKIGNLFTHLDHLITLHQRKLKSLKNTKKVFLNKMFV